MVTKPSGGGVLKRVKRLLYDIEVTHNIVLAFRAGYEQTIRSESIIAERKIVCIGYKWEGQKKVTVLRWDKKQDDKAMLKAFLAVANEADELIGHNADRYDGPFVRTRCLFHGFAPIPQWKTIDTLQWARRYYMFNSNTLDYISKFLGFKGKTKTDYQLWHDVLLKNCPKALDRMCKYCGDDVLRLEEVYEKMKFCVKAKSHAGIVAGRDLWSCARCASEHVIKNKTKISAAGTLTHAMQCQSCGGFYQISATTYEKYQRAKAKHSCKRV